MSPIRDGFHIHGVAPRSTGSLNDGADQFYDKAMVGRVMNVRRSSTH